MSVMSTEDRPIHHVLRDGRSGDIYMYRKRSLHYGRDDNVRGITIAHTHSPRCAILVYYGSSVPMLMDEEHVEVTTPSRPTFTREQKFGYAIVIVCGVLAVFLGVSYMVKHVKAPFIVSYTGSRFMTGEEEKAAEVEKQKATDTDGDTISDYDEMKIYGSSPYLRDTDSDGQDDDVEIASNQDPACARGGACEDESDEIQTGESLVGTLAGTSVQDAAAAAQELEDLKAMLQAQTPEDIRAMLIDSGADQAQVDAMTDEELTVFYANVLAELEASGGLVTLLEQVQAQGAVAPDASANATP